MGSAPVFRRLSWREALTSAGAAEATDGWSIRGPAGEVVADRIQGAFTPWRRMRGLLGRQELREGEALVLRPCSQVHTIGMRFEIDAVFCDRDLKVLCVETLPPGRMSRHVRRAWCCVELPGGTADRCGIVSGDRLRFVPPQGS